MRITVARCVELTTATTLLISLLTCYLVNCPGPTEARTRHMVRGCHHHLHSALPGPKPVAGRGSFTHYWICLWRLWHLWCLESWYWHLIGRDWSQDLYTSLWFAMTIVMSLYWPLIGRYWSGYWILASYWSDHGTWIDLRLVKDYHGTGPGYWPLIGQD